jgi:hypothetical protein
MTVEQYYLMCEEMGWEPKEEEIPVDASTLDFEVQQALMVFNMLPDKFEGMSGTWLGKDFSPLQVFMDVYEIYEQRNVLDYILVVQSEYGKYYSEKQQMNRAMSKSKGRK